MYDLVIRGGEVVDGTGGAPFAADVAVKDGRIAAVGKVADAGREEIDAKGFAVTPGFVDLHTHYDGQALWSERLEPSSNHGVTTAVMGNCGVGFAPCRAADRDMLVHVMEGVEDIPGAVMAEGLPWDWESFPEYLDSVARRKRDIDVTAYIPHSAVRVYAMGARGAHREPATDADIAKMQGLVRDGMAAGALGFASSRQWIHRTSEGAFIPTYETAAKELEALVGAMDERGVFQIVLDVPHSTWAQEFAVMERAIDGSGRTTMFSFGTGGGEANAPEIVLSRVRAANAKGRSIRPQVFPRPIGIITGHDLSANPFMDCPTYRALPKDLGDRVKALRDPAVRAKILAEKPDGKISPLQAMSNNFAQTFEMGNPPDYEPDPKNSILARAKREGVDPRELAYDLLLKDDGHAMLYVAIGNYETGTLDPLREVLLDPNSVLGLGDGGAHYGMICDASFPTFMLSHWVRDRRHDRLPLPWVVQALSAEAADAIGFRDRGRIAVGQKADLNVIDLDRIALRKPEVRYDLPAGGRRIAQQADGYVATIVSGAVIARDGVRTGALPGQLVRANQVWGA